MVAARSNREIVVNIYEVVGDVHSKGEHKRDVQIPFVKH